jgi:hypothetical protein
MSEEKCTLCGAPVIDFTDRQDLFSGINDRDFPVSERRAIKSPHHGKLYCAAYKYMPPLACIGVHCRREEEKQLREEFDVHCPECGCKKPRLLFCSECDGNLWMCPICGEEWSDEGNPCCCSSEGDPDRDDLPGEHDSFEHAYYECYSDADPGL